MSRVLAAWAEAASAASRRNCTRTKRLGGTSLMAVSYRIIESDKNRNAFLLQMRKAGGSGGQVLRGMRGSAAGGAWRVDRRGCGSTGGFPGRDERQECSAVVLHPVAGMDRGDYRSGEQTLSARHCGCARGAVSRVSGVVLVCGVADRRLGGFAGAALQHDRDGACVRAARRAAAFAGAGGVDCDDREGEPLGTLPAADYRGDGGAVCGRAAGLAIMRKTVSLDYDIV